MTRAFLPLALFLFCVLSANSAFAQGPILQSITSNSQTVTLTVKTTTSLTNTYYLWRSTTSGAEGNAKPYTVQTVPGSVPPVGSTIQLTDPTAVNGQTYYYKVSIASNNSSTRPQSNELDVVSQIAVPLTVTALAINPSSVTGGASTTGTVTMSGSAPTNGVTVFLSNDTQSLGITTNVFVPAGTTSALFPMTTTAVTASATTNITATYNGVSKSAMLTVNPAPVLTSIAVSPSTASLTTGGTQTFTAVAKDQNGTALATQPLFVWSVASGGVGSITSGGVYSAGSSAGSATVKATSGTVPGTATVTVNASLPSVSDLSTYATGNGRIALYWTPVPNAVGYNIYRGTSAGGEDYVHPVNGAALVNAASYSGSPMDLYSDTGLTNGSQYFYTVKAVYSAGQSQPSNEDNEIPDPDAVPWDTRNPGAIISAFNAAFASDTSNIGADPYTLRVVGPDNTIYDPSFSTAQPPDGTVTPGTNQFVRPDGSTQALPDDEGELDPPSQATSSPSPNAVGTALKGDKGPFRRVSTRKNANGSGDYRGATGTFYLPGASVTDIGSSNHGNDPVIYLGISGSSIAVDAGLAYQKAKGMWALEMQVGGKIVAAQGGSILPVPLENAPTQYQRFAPGSSVIMSYWAWGTYKTTGRAKLSLLIVDDFDNSTAAALGAPSRYLQREENVRAKRVHAVAQNAAGVFPTGTTVNAASWSQGSVFLPDASGSVQGWSSADGTLPGEDGYYDGGKSDVNANRTSPYIQEDGVTISIHSN